jgi:subtilisin-like proprotein convertase family protein
MLAQNPSLTWRDVKHILVRSSYKINPTDPGWSSGPFSHNEKFGFGLVDAQAAVNLAATWTNVAAESAIPAVTRTLNLTIPDNNATGLTDSITIGSEFSNFIVEHVEVVFNATHSWRGDLEVRLTSPAGVVSQLATVRDSDSGDNFSSWRFGSARYWGESAAGAWTLRIADRAAADVGTWNSWTLRIFGTQGSSTLTVTKAGTGSGTVTSSPAGITCGATCAASFANGTVVTLTATPDAGSSFAGWSGDCNSSGQVTLDAAKTCTATFTLISHTLTVTVRGSASGTVTSSPTGISCSTGSTCTANYTNGTTVTLTEAPGSGASFKQWGGACSGTATTCMVTMTANQSVTATFSQLFTDPTLTVGSTSIKAVHFTELRSAINTLRAVNGRAAFAWTDPTLTAGSTAAKKVHLDDLRTALTQAYQAAGQSAPSYTDPTIVAQQTMIKASHISELRTAVRALE